jgi:protein-disulfide isomerase
MIFNIKLIKILTLFFFISCSFISSSYTDSELPENHVNQLGSDTAEYLLVEYASMSCVHCANFHNNEFSEIKKNFIDTGKLKFIYKDFPLDRPAMFASMVANCFKGGQYFEVLSSLFRNQKAWVTESDNSGKFYSAIHNILKVHGISLQKVLECVDDKSEINKKTWNRIIASRLEGQKDGVNSTPSFFLNGKKLEEPLNYELIQKLLK